MQKAAVSISSIVFKNGLYEKFIFKQQKKQGGISLLFYHINLIKIN